MRSSSSPGSFHSRKGKWGKWGESGGVWRSGGRGSASPCLPHRSRSSKGSRKPPCPLAACPQVIRVGLIPPRCPWPTWVPASLAYIMHPSLTPSSFSLAASLSPGPSEDRKQPFLALPGASCAGPVTVTFPPSHEALKTPLHMVTVISTL